MPNKEDLVSKIKETVTERMKHAIEEGRKQYGDHPGQTVMSAKQQMAAYDALTADDIQIMIQQNGLEQTNEYIGKMEMRKRKMKHGLQT